MKLSTQLIFGLALVLALSTTATAQAVENCDELKNTVDQLEKMEKNISVSLQPTHQKLKLEVYTQYRDCIQRDIAVATEMLRVVQGTNAARVASEKLDLLNAEKAHSEQQISELQQALKQKSAPNQELSASESTSSAGQGSVAGNNNAAAGNANESRTSSASRTSASAQKFPCVAAQPYSNAPELLTDIVSKAVSDAVGDGSEDIDIDNISAALNKMVLYTIFDAASGSSSAQLHSLQAYQYLGETARTDKQLGGAANTDGGISAIEKPGFAQLLGFALEHGGITKKRDGTNLTLSTSLYSLYSMIHGDTAETYDRAGILNRIGASATFAVENETNELANARRNNLSEWSVKARLFGDRSTRSKGYQIRWDRDIRPAIRRRLLALGGAVEGLSQNIPQFSAFRRDFDDCLHKDLQKLIDRPDFKAKTLLEKKTLLNEAVLAELRSNVFDRVNDKSLEVTDEVVSLIEGKYLPDLKTALDSLVEADKDLQDAIADLQKGPLATFAFTNYRVPTASDYSEAKFLFEQEKGFMGPLKLIGNLGFSFYNRPDRSLNQEKVRDIFAALSFEGSSDSPFTEAENRSKITYSFVGRYQRLFENRGIPGRTADIGTLQFVTEIPLFRGLSLPFSVTYSSATEEEKKQGFRFNFGTRFDMDKLVELLRANSKL